MNKNCSGSITTCYRSTACIFVAEITEVFRISSEPFATTKIYTVRSNRNMRSLTLRLLNRVSAPLQQNRTKLNRKNTAGPLHNSQTARNPSVHPDRPEPMGTGHRTYPTTIRDRPDRRPETFVGDVAEADISEPSAETDRSCSALDAGREVLCPATVLVRGRKTRTEGFSTEA